MIKKAHLPLTEREEDIFAYILGYVVDNRFSPTRQEIADRFEITPQGVQKFIQSLEDKGRIITVKSNGKRIARNIVIVEQISSRSISC